MNPSFAFQMMPALRGAALRRGTIFAVILLIALLAFEVFNYSTTAFALTDILGEVETFGLRWSTILALAFCGIDFAGIARLFTPQQGREEPVEVWYLFGAWLLAAGFNAALTWWGVSLAILNHAAAGSLLIGQAAMTQGVPIFVALMVWVVRVLLIGTFSIAGEDLFSVVEKRSASRTSLRPGDGNQPASSYPRPAPKPTPAVRPAPPMEPTYHPVGLSAHLPHERPHTRT